MRIAVNTRFLLKSKMEGFGWFTYETVKRMVENHPDDEFYFFFDRPFDKKFIFAKNVHGIVLQPQARRPLLFKIWFNYSVKKALKKNKIDVFYSPDGYLSLTSKCPQVGVIHDLNFEHYPEDLPNWASRYLLNYFPKFAKKAKQIITVSEFSKKDIIANYGIDKAKITVAYNGASELFKPLEASVKQHVREEFSNGDEYFLFVGALHARKNVERLFQAFDQFKSNTKSNAKLIIVGEQLWGNKSIENTFNQLSHKEAISFTGHLQFDKLTRIVAAAKALVFPSYFEGFGIPIVEAMQSGTPVICGNLTATPEIAGEAALLVDPFSVESISNAIQKIDQDEKLQIELREKGLERAKAFSWNKTAAIIWDELVKSTQD